MSPEEEEVALIVQRDNLTALEFGHRREQSLEKAANGMAETSDKTIEDELWVMSR